MLVLHFKISLLHSFLYILTNSFPAVDTRHGDLSSTAGRLQVRSQRFMYSDHETSCSFTV